MTAMRKLHGRCIGVAIDGNRLDAIALQLDDDFLAEFAGAEQQHALGAGAQGGAKNRHHPSSETCFNDTADRAPCTYTDCIRRTGNSIIRRPKIVSTPGPATDAPSPEDSRVGKEGARTVRSRGSP